MGMARLKVGLLGKGECCVGMEETGNPPTRQTNANKGRTHSQDSGVRSCGCPRRR